MFKHFGDGRIRVRLVNGDTLQSACEKYTHFWFHVMLFVCVISILNKQLKTSVECAMCRKAESRDASVWCLCHVGAARCSVDVQRVRCHRRLTRLAAAASRRNLQCQSCVSSVVIFVSFELFHATSCFSKRFGSGSLYVVALISRRGEGY